MENGALLNRMSRDLIFNGVLQTLKGNIKVQDVKYQLAQKADTIPQLLIAFTKFGILDDNTELFKVYQNIYVYSIGYLIEKLKSAEQSFSRTPSNNHIQLNSIIRSVKNRMSIEMDPKSDQRQYNSVDFNQNERKYKSGLDYVQEQIKKKLQQQNTSKDLSNSSNNYYCQIQKTEESIVLINLIQKQNDDIRNTQTSTLQQASRIYFNSSSAQQELEKQVAKLQDINEAKDYQIKQLQDQIQSKTTKLKLQVEQIENQEKYILRLKQQELKYIKLMGTVSEYIQKIIVQIQQKIDRKQKCNQEPDNFHRQIQSARAEYAAKIKSQQLFLSNSKFQSIINSKLIDLQNQMTETKLLSQQIDDLIQAAEFLELESSFRFDFE